MAGALDGLGYGRALGRFILEDGADSAAARRAGRGDRGRAPASARPPPGPTCCGRSSPRAGRPGGSRSNHRWKHASILAQAWRHGVPMTVHPGDRLRHHRQPSGVQRRRDRPGGRVGFQAVRRLAPRPRRRRRALDRLGHHGAAGLREGAELRQQPPAPGRPPASCAAIRSIVVDLQDGGGWDWTQGEPPKTNPAYYLRFCKSFSRMGGALNYVQCDNLTFLHHLYRRLDSS